MLEKIKEVPFIDESSAVKVFTEDGKVVLERTDRVVWAREATSLLCTEDIECYVEADKFFSLLPEIKTLSQDSCLKVELKNGAKYELPFLTVAWDALEMPTEFDGSINFKLSDLMLCTLKNLIRPELQCIYIDEEGAVTCDYVSACISSEVKFSKALLLPPDVQALVDGRLCKLKVDTEKLFISASDFDIVTSLPTAGEEQWWDQLRNAIGDYNALSYVSNESLSGSLKRLVMFGDYVSFDGCRVISESNFEPFSFQDLGPNQYEIERLSKVISITGKISACNGNIVLKGDKTVFMVSPMEEA